ncbi:putative gcrA cell cycle regulator [Dinoroseobacter shibae DFL 12 = DSM 16493]|uniref:Putative gcrA cell cycle regulator n=1 Tax=Dinoroseobacter shibae (strain DSM 16493 / NCIMB 14021 / DFL 12) TaxID=398580 RepID=A8LI15_DINSH|nr:MULTISPECIES: GcrA family cell cycle regulator [Dinoroseobacter]ABV94349.1 putative gcrA cell cycle regulator [Dinoroseobacter shibae DFL 12 = DSM 16493]MDD9717687.1 GcrA family cell cycle regulator [Dinoroseobacter sp. PD6]URF45780.1 GcrA cell cycle regulator [Dinoroseobacter shibae]URF50086.1 GcrA cell cycle regulator [Dinoroseobacter shibae]
MSWTDERVEILKTMWGEGKSASQIAKELGGVTRNAVIGKVHRLGLSNRNGGGGSTAAKAAEPAKKDSAQAAAKPAKAAEKPRPAPEPANTPKTDAARPAEAAPAAASAPEPTPLRRTIVPAGQPLPPQPSANEISPEALASVREVEKKAKKLSLMELTERTCKWPIGDPATEEFWFCGLPVQAGKPYCEAHVGVAFQPMSSRRDRRR